MNHTVHNLHIWINSQHISNKSFYAASHWRSAILTETDTIFLFDTIFFFTSSKISCSVVVFLSSEQSKNWFWIDLFITTRRYVNRWALLLISVVSTIWTSPQFRNWFLIIRKMLYELSINIIQQFGILRAMRYVFHNLISKFCSTIF
jgi:hypothetical protein